MKSKIFIALLLITLLSCKKSFRNQYYDTCMKSAQNHYDLTKYNNKAASEKMCSCMADKLAAKYNSEAEMKKDVVVAVDIIEQCKKDYAAQR